MILHHASLALGSPCRASQCQGREMSKLERRGEAVATGGREGGREALPTAAAAAAMSLMLF